MTLLEWSTNCKPEPATRDAVLAGGDLSLSTKSLVPDRSAAIKLKLSGASPDYADALAMAHCSDGGLDFTTALSERVEAVMS